jgi:arginine decarboxylase
MFSVATRRGGGVAMIWKKVTRAAATSGAAEGGTALNAFDNALLAAGIGNVNLVKVSSIVPPDVDIVALPRIKPGAIVPTAYAAMTSDTPGETIAAAVGYALPEDRTKAGVIMEYHDRADRKTAEDTVRAMLSEALAARGERAREVQVFAVQHRVQRVGCALAAVTLLSEDDLL